MAGFLYNGCGACDSYYKLKDLGNVYCRCCKKERPWALMELKMKIRIVFIPTVSIGTKYAIVCTACKNGYYVDEEQKNFVLNHPPSRVGIQQDGVTFYGLQGGGAQSGGVPAAQGPPQGAIPQQPAIPPQMPRQAQSVPQQPAQPQVSQMPQQAQFVPQQPLQFAQPSPAVQPQGVTPSSASPGRTCNFCGGMVEQEAIFCGRCGKRLTAPPLSQSEGERVGTAADSFAVLRRRKICPSCQMMFAVEKEFCDICGTRLTEKG